MGRQVLSKTRGICYTLITLAFEKKHSTDHCLSYFNDESFGKGMKDFDKGMMADMILIDLKSAFDTIDYYSLLQKLYAIGFSKRTVNWFISYLSNISFLVNLGNNFFQPASVSCDVFNICQWHVKSCQIGSFFMPMIHAFSVNIKTLMKFKNN